MYVLHHDIYHLLMATQSAERKALCTALRPNSLLYRSPGATESANLSGSHQHRQHSSTARHQCETNVGTADFLGAGQQFSQQ